MYTVHVLSGGLHREGPKKALREPQIESTKKTVSLCMRTEQIKPLGQKTETRDNVCP